MQAPLADPDQRAPWPDRHAPARARRCHCCCHWAARTWFADSPMRCWRRWITSIRAIGWNCCGRWISGCGSTAPGILRLRRLSLHRNTVRNRIDRIAALTGRRLDDGDDRMELWLGAQGPRRPAPVSYSPPQSGSSSHPPRQATNLAVMTRIACCQIDPVMADLDGEHRTDRRADRRGGGAGADIVVLPELATSGYMFADADEARSVASTPASPQSRTGLRPSVMQVAIFGFCEAVTGQALQQCRRRRLRRPRRASPEVPTSGIGRS